MAREIVQSLRGVNGKYEQYYFATILSAVAVADDGTDSRNAKEYIDDLVKATADAMRFMGVIGTDGAITSTLLETKDKNIATLTDYKIGWSFKVGEAGTYHEQHCEVGDMLIVIGESGTDADWYVLQANIDGAVTGPVSAADQVMAMFSGTTGKVIADSGISKSSLEEVITNNHTHTNKEVLDTITQTMINTWNGYKDQLDSIHTHDNKAVLDKITQELVDLWNGYDAKIKNIEASLVYTNETATTASATATEAKELATTADGNATTALNTATEAKTIASTAKSTADTAKSTADEAKTIAEGKVSVVWVEQGGAIPTENIVNNSLCFKIL